jgi:hypothetical protein
MGRTRASGKLIAMSRVGGLSVVVLLVFAVSLGAAVHNHALVGVDGGGENISPTKLTCPACVFDGKPVTVVGAHVTSFDASALPLTIPATSSFERILDRTLGARAPPAA